jgi:hypothetical protein
MSTQTAVANVVHRDEVSARRYGLSGFRVAGYDDQHQAFTEPVEVRCLGCGTRKRFGEFAGTAHGCGGTIDELVAWTKDHACPGS